MSEPHEIVTDSAGITARYTPICEVKPGDAVLVGWRSTVREVERRDDLYRIFTEGWDAPMTDFMPAQTLYPIEVPREPSHG